MAWEPSRPSRRPVSDRNTSSRSADLTDSASTSIGCASSRSSTVRTDWTAPSLGTWRASASSSRVAPAEQRAARSSSVSSGNSRRTLPPGTRRFSSLGVPSATIRPWSSNAIRDARRSASSRYWVVSRMVTPSATSSRTICHMTRRLRGSRPVVGSSRKMIRGSPIERHRQVEAAPHAARVGLRRLRRRRRPARTARAARRPGAVPRPCRDGTGRPSACRFSSPVNCLSTAETWPGDADRGPGPRRARGDVVTARR